MPEKVKIDPTLARMIQKVPRRFGDWPAVLRHIFLDRLDAQ